MPAADINISNANLSPLPPIRVNCELMMMMMMMIMMIIMMIMMVLMMNDADGGNDG